VTHDEDREACAASVDPGLTAAASAGLAADLAPACHRRDLRADGVFYLRGLLMPQVAGNRSGEEGHGHRGRGPAVFSHDGPGRERDRRGVCDIRDQITRHLTGVLGE